MSEPRICIASPNRNVWSETFVANHIAHLPGVELVLTDGHLPQRNEEGIPLVPNTLLMRVLRRFSRSTPEDVLRAQLIRILSMERIDVLLAEFGPTGDALREVCTKARVPLVTHFHGVDAFHTKLLKDSGNYAALFRDSAALVVVSTEMEQQLLALGAPREKLHFNCYGIDVERFQPGAPDRAPKHLLAVGRFVDKKAPHLTLTAFHHAWQRDQELRLTMAGQGPLWESTKQLALALGLHDVVTFPGVLDQEQVGQHMRRSRAFVQHSMVTADNDHEGTPLSILEAMASGLPVIATLHGGIPDVVEHGITGLLSAERDAEAMAAHINALASDPLRAARMGAAGRERAVRDHTLGASLERLHAILLRTIDN